MTDTNEAAERLRSLIRKGRGPNEYLFDPDAALAWERRRTVERMIAAAAKDYRRKASS